MVRHGKRSALACISAGLLLGALAFVAAPAVAQCSPDPPTSGATVTCTGNPSGFTTSGLATLTVDVLVGTNFNGPFSASVMNQLSVTTAGNMQTMTFSAIDVLTLAISGNINNGLAVSGFSTLALINSGSINNTLLLTGTGNLSFTTSGNINSGITVNGAGSHSFVNSGYINQIFSLSGGGSDSVQNSGTINPGIQKSGNGTLSVTNDASGTINQGIFVTGSAQTTIDNFGTIQSAITLGTGNDQITNNGTLNGDSTMGDGDNTFLMQGGRLNGNVIQGSGSDLVVISGGEITGAARTGAGNDTLLWTGGLVGSIDMGTGNDRATLQGLTTTNLRGITIDGGQGSDVLVFSGTVGDQPQRLLNWEAIELLQGSRLTMNGNLTLGDSATGSGILTIDSTSRLLVGEQGIRTIVPFAAGQLTTVVNAGVIDLSNGGTSTSDRLGIAGNYVGQNGRLMLNSVLAGDGSPSDRLVVSGGVMSGSTTIAVTNVGGQGAQTSGNGIRVVTAASGATSTATAFSLSGRVAAGAYEYQLFRGGFTRGTGNNWYLRNTISPIPPVPPDPAPTPTPTPTPTPPSPGGGGDTSGAEDAANAADAASVGITGGIPLYRPEVALHAVMPSVARTAVRATLGTFHDREGETAFASGDGAFKAGWARLFGGSYKQSWSGDVSPAFNGTVLGVQVGLPLLGLEHGSGEKDRAGLFFGYASASGSVTGFALGQQGMPVGNIAISAYSAGAYWTHFWPAGGYVDAVLMVSWLTGSTLSSLNVATNAYGRMGTASLELGYPIPLGGTWAIEPQAQGIFQRWNGDATQDTFSNVSNVEDDIVTARFGLRLTNTIVADKMIIKPFAQVNLWQNFGGQDTITFGSTTIATNLLATALEFSGGVSASLGTWADLYAKVSYTTGIDANSQSAVSGRLGFRLFW
jgi:outer membrane autotransporter protein